MKLQIHKVSLLLLTLLVLSSCKYVVGENGLIRDRGEGYYLEAEVTPELDIPETLDSYTIDQLYVIPELASANEELYLRAPMPKPIERRRQEGVVIQGLGNRRWILIDATPSQVWPLVRDYWTQLQVVLDYENPIDGIMETSWLEVNNDPESRNKYRLVIEPGLHAGYSEVYITHLSMSRAEPPPTVVTWPEESVSDDLERQITDSVSQYLADRNDVYQASSSSLLAGSISADSKANIKENDQGNQILELKLGYNRAWVQVRQALSEAGVDIVEANRDEYFINVNFAGEIEEEERKSWFRRIFSRGNAVALGDPVNLTVRLQESEDVINVVTESTENSSEIRRLQDELIEVITANLT